jgi:chemotaxis signal transduction protein
MTTEHAAESTAAVQPRAGSGQRRFTFDVGTGARLMTRIDVQQEIPLGARLQVLPNAPPALAGAVNLRGAIRIVFDPLAALSRPERPANRRILLIDRENHCAGTLIIGEPRLDELQTAAGIAGSGPWAAQVRQVWTVVETGETVLEIDHRDWFTQLRDLSLTA